MLFGESAEIQNTEERRKSEAAVGWQIDEWRRKYNATKDKL